MLKPLKIGTEEAGHRLAETLKKHHGIIPNITMGQAPKKAKKVIADVFDHGRLL